MNRRDLARLFAVSAAAVPGLLLSASIASAQVISSDGFPASVPKAICGPGDHTESGLQGETTVQERFSGDSERAYNCNLELVGAGGPRHVSRSLFPGWTGVLRRVRLLWNGPSCHWPRHQGDRCLRPRASAW